ncbi:MAG: hypothetical protein COA67_07665 [Lutibacter sp.]|nr:MAG: hypothetical protein COA67_07665 [Lutibacter sp.]
MNKTKHLFLYITLSFVVSYAQNNISERVELEWNDNTSVTTSRNNKLQVPTVTGQFLDEDLLPIYTKSWKITKGYAIDSYKITNVNYQIITANFSKNTTLNKIPATIQSKLNVATSRDESEVILTLTPLIKEGSLVKKVISFNIEYKLKRKLSSRLTNSKSAFNSVLSTGTWYKFSVDTTGVFKIDRSFLQSLGVNTSSINPKNIKIYGNGGNMLPFLNSDFRYDDLEENAIFVSGEDDNKFDSSDFILFYAKGSDAWKVDMSGLNTRHQKNIFSDKSYYFINVDGNAGKRIQNDTPITTVSNQQITSYNDYDFYEKEDHNIVAIGQQWFGENLTIENVQTFTIPFKNIDTSQDIQIRVRGVVESETTSQMAVKVNGQDLYTINFPAITNSLVHAIARENIGSLSAVNEAVTVEITFNNNGNPSAKAHLDYIEVIGKKLLTVDDKQFGFRSFDAANGLGTVQYQIQNATEIWDVTDFVNPVKITNQSATGGFEFNATAGILKEYVALNDTDYFTPEKLPNSLVENQNLHALEDIDYVIVTRDFLIGEAERLADFHRNRGLTVEVVDLEKIYNEFSSGSPDLTAIRDFTKYLYDNATLPEKRIKYLCLFGDASYDYKDRINGNNNIVPALQSNESFNLATSYITDDYYGMMDANEGLLGGADRQDVATGRIPVSDVIQASNAINKIINYNSTNSYGDWRNQITLIADDIDASGEEILQESLERIADSIKVRKPILNVKKIYADAYVQQTSSGGERYPDVNTEISNAVERGTLMANYFGHGGEDGWAGERILEISEIQGWSNFNTLPLIITITCEFSKFDNPLRLAGGEYIVWNKDGGSISLITTTREIYINVGRIFNERLMKVLLTFNDEDFTIAEALMIVKNQTTTSQRLFIYYLGDPAMKLAVPKADVRLTQMNGVDIATSLDTIKALSHVTFNGIVTDPSGNLLTDYNGELSATVFDKEIIRTTLDNDNFGITMEFDALESKIFRGRAAVENGLFTFDFIAPRDLRIAYGKGKLSFYADNDIIDKAGYNFDVTIGGINENAPEDNIGPEIQLYMNDESFVDGGNTNASPLFLAVLEDENGINTSITAVDHDIVAVLDGDTANPFILNDYYQTELNDYTKGKVKYPLRNLETGMHTIELCAWDTYNNPSCATLTFVVVNDADMVLDNVLNYPNPFINHTEFWFNHNKPNEPLEVQIQIFTVSGKLVKTINQLVQSTGNLSRSVTWNGLDDFGDKIGKGVYVYKLNVKSTLSNAKAEKYEKLVILQ